MMVKYADRQWNRIPASFEAEAEGRDSLPKRLPQPQSASPSVPWPPRAKLRQVTCAGTMACSSRQRRTSSSTCARGATQQNRRSGRATLVHRSQLPFVKSFARLEQDAGQSHQALPASTQRHRRRRGNTVSQTGCSMLQPDSATHAARSCRCMRCSLAQRKSSLHIAKSEPLLSPVPQLFPAPHLISVKPQGLQLLQHRHGRAEAAAVRWGTCSMRCLIPRAAPKLSMCVASALSTCTVWTPVPTWL